MLENSQLRGVHDFYKTFFLRRYKTKSSWFNVSGSAVVEMFAVKDFNSDWNLTAGQKCWKLYRDN